MNELRIECDTDVLVPGEAVRVRVVLVLGESVKVRGVHAEFWGAEETRAVYTTYNAATKSTQVQTAVQHEDVVKEEYLLSGRERKGFVGTVADGFATLFGGGEHDVLRAGVYEFEAELVLPAGAPVSFEGAKCRVFYELKAWVDVPMGRDMKAKRSFEVKGDVAVIDGVGGGLPMVVKYPEDKAKGFWDSWLKPDVKVEAGLDRDVLRAGEVVGGTFVMETGERLAYRSIKVRLVCVEKSEAHGHHDGHTHEGAAHEVAGEGVIEGIYSADFELPIECVGPIAAKGKRFAVEHFVQIELDVPWAKDPKVLLPVRVVG